MTPEGFLHSDDGLDQFSADVDEEVPIEYEDYANLFGMSDSDPISFLTILAENRPLLERVCNLLGQFSHNKHEEVSEFSLTCQQLLFRGACVCLSVSRDCNP
jgi:hypothetical protein